MAYNVFPKTEKELLSKIKSYPKDLQAELVVVFKYFRKNFSDIDTPINLDVAVPKQINVNRKIKTDLAKVSKTLKLKSLKMKPGNGSSGNRGANNKGAAFEVKFRVDILDWWAGKTAKIDPKTLKAIEDLDNTYGISKSKKFDAKSEGAANTKRPLQFADTGITLLNSKGRGLNVGKSISDITLVLDKPSDNIYLSLKSSSTVTFFNVGVRTILTPEEIKAGKITNSNGLRLLKLFGIDPKKFCDVFNGTGKPSSEVATKADKPGISALLESGIGYGYHILHQFPKSIESKKMDKAAMKSAAKVGDVTVYYGGQTGGGKRIDIVFESADYSFKLNIRDTQGKDGFPTRLMCDFKHK